MPELYGNPYKSDLYEQVDILSRRLAEANRTSQALEGLYKEEREKTHILEQQLAETKRRLTEIANGLPGSIVTRMPTLAERRALRKKQTG